MKYSHFAMVVFGIVLLAQAVLPLSCFGDEVKWTGKYKGHVLTDAADVINYHPFLFPL